MIMINELILQLKPNRKCFKMHNVYAVPMSYSLCHNTDLIFRIGIKITKAMVTEQRIMKKKKKNH